jgi:hypothetical protein
LIEEMKQLVEKEGDSNSSSCPLEGDACKLKALNIAQEQGNTAKI